MNTIQEKALQTLADLKGVSPRDLYYIFSISESDGEKSALLNLAGEDDKAEFEALEKRALRFENIAMLGAIILAIAGISVVIGGLFLGGPPLALAGVAVCTFVFAPILLALINKNHNMHDKVIAKFREICEKAEASDHSKNMSTLGQTAAPEASPDASPSPGSIAVKHSRDSVTEPNQTLNNGSQ